MTIDYVVQLPNMSSDKASFYEEAAPELVLEGPDNAVSAVSEGDYTSLTWNPKLPHSSLEYVSSWGTKTFPGDGPFCFMNTRNGPVLGLLSDFE